MCRSNTTKKKRSVGTLYVQKIFPNKIKFRRNDRFVEKRVPRNAFRRNAICVENFPRYNIVPQERKVCRNYDHLENAFRRNAICVENFPRYNIVPYERKICRNNEHLERRSVGTLYVYKIFPNKIKFHRNERFVEIMNNQKVVPQERYVFRKFSQIK